MAASTDTVTVLFKTTGVTKIFEHVRSVRITSDMKLHIRTEREHFIYETVEAQIINMSKSETRLGLYALYD